MACKGCSTGTGILLDSEFDFRVADDSTSGKVAPPLGARVRNIISILMTYPSTLSRRSVKLAVLAAVLFFFLCGIAGWGQTAGQSTLPLPGAQRENEDAWGAQQKPEMAKKANVKRQQDLKKDTDKLLELATKLKQYVDKTNENMLSVEVIKKAGEIEKLAHSVKEKAKRE